MNELILNCNQSISSTIDRDMVESEREFLSYNANPLLIETMSADTFTSIDVIEYEIDFYCFLIGTSNPFFIIIVHEFLHFSQKATDV